MGDYVAGQVPLWLDVGYRLNSDFYVGGFFQYGFGIVNDDRQDACRLDNVDCSASDTRLGVMGRYHLPVNSPLSPWLGFGVGYEWGTFTLNQSVLGSSSTDATWSGFEFANLQVGADYHVAPKVALAPFRQRLVRPVSAHLHEDHHRHDHDDDRRGRGEHLRARVDPDRRAHRVHAVKAAAS